MAKSSSSQSVKKASGFCPAPLRTKNSTKACRCAKPSKKNREGFVLGVDAIEDPFGGPLPDPRSIKGLCSCKNETTQETPSEKTKEAKNARQSSKGKAVTEIEQLRAQATDLMLDFRCPEDGEDDNYYYDYEVQPEMESPTPACQEQKQQIDSTSLFSSEFGHQMVLE